MMKYIFLLIFMLMHNTGFCADLNWIADSSTTVTSVGAVIAGPAGTYQNSLSNIYDEDYTTYYGFLNASGGAACTVTLTTTATFNVPVALDLIRIKLLTRGAGPVFFGLANGYCKLYDKSNVLIATIDSFSGVHSTRDNTYTTGWTGVKKVILYTYCEGTSYFGAVVARIDHYELYAEGPELTTGNQIISFL